MYAIALITTTINVPEVLHGYARDAREHGREVKIYVAGDRKTKAGAADYCARLARETGIECEYLDPVSQDRFLARWPELREHLPWNCIQRRNVAILKAFCDGADALVTVDDDNLVAEDDYFEECMRVCGGPGATLTLPAYGKRGDWFNVCRFLATANNYQFVPRGYGMSARADLDDGSELATGPSLTMPAAVVAGLWLGDPDVDAATRIAHRIEVTDYRLDHNFFLAPGAHAPFNSQNTILARAVIPAYFLSPRVGRYDDIFASFVVRRIAEHLGWGICFGRPLVRQERNEHDLLRDFDLERFGMRHADSLTEDLTNVVLTKSDFASCAVEICDQLEPGGNHRNGSRNETNPLAAFLSGYRIWAELPVWCQGLSLT